jgi:hypothetical protein
MAVASGGGCAGPLLRCCCWSGFSDRCDGGGRRCSCCDDCRPLLPPPPPLPLRGTPTVTDDRRSPLRDEEETQRLITDADGGRVDHQSIMLGGISCAVRPPIVRTWLRCSTEMRTSRELFISLYQPYDDESTLWWTRTRIEDIKIGLLGGVRMVSESNNSGTN